MKTTRLNILYQSNDAYAAITGVSMTSLLQNNKNIDILTIYLINDNISKTNLKKFKELCASFNRKINIIDSRKILEKVKQCSLAPYRGGYTTYFKLFAFEEIKTNNDMLLLLDGDTIITGSLINLCHMDMSQNAIAATYDCIYNGYKKMIDIPKNEGYYNAGVLYINQKLWRKHKYEKQIINHVNKIRNKYYLADQDLINVLFRNKIKYLNLTYNFNSGFYIYGVKNIHKLYKLKYPYFHETNLINEVIKNPLVIHCMGAMTGRPWEENNSHPQGKLFDQYLKKSLWSDYNKIQPKQSLLFKIQKKLFEILPKKIYIYIHRTVQHIFYIKSNNGVLK